jgi:hypothetical protein
MILQPAPEVRQLNRRHWSWQAAVLSGMQPLLSRIDEHTIAMNVSRIIR